MTARRIVCNAFISATGEYYGGPQRVFIRCELRLGHKERNHLGHHHFDTRLQFRWATPRTVGRWVTERMSPRTTVTYYKQGSP